MQERLKLDLSQKTSVSQGITTRVNDGGIHSIDVTALNYGDVFDLTGYKITFELTTSAKTIAFDSVNGKITDPKNGEFTYTIPKEITGVAGIAERAYFSFVKEDKRITSADIDMTILQLVDITAEEARSYIAEYNKLVEDLNQAYKDAIDQMSKDYEVVQEKINGIMAELSALKLQIEAYQKSVEKTANEALYTVDEAISKLESADVVNKAELQGYLTGGKLSTNSKTDFKNKITSSVVENPHIAYEASTNALINPNEYVFELAQQSYTSIFGLDTNLYTTNANSDKAFRQIVFSFDLVTDVDRRFPGLFAEYRATTQEKKVAITRQLITNLIPSLYGYGSGVSGNKLTLSVYDGKAWVGSTANNTGTIKKITYTDWNKPSSINRFINDNGFVNLIAYAPASDGITLSVVNIDYISLDYTLETSTSDLYASKSEFKTFTERRDNPHEVNAAQVKAVALTGNEDISGVKNFNGSLQYKGKDVVSDSGWIDLKWATNFGNHSSDIANKPRIRMKNGTVALVGIGTPTVAIPKEIYDYPFITGIPSEMLPDVPYVGTISQGSGKAIFHVKLIVTNGTVQIERYRDETGFLAIPTGNYLPVNLTWLV